MADSSKRISVPTTSSYEDAVWKLGLTLQSDPNALAKARASGVKKGPSKVTIMKSYINRSGLSMDDVDKLSVIHISGTKGKGSTCAYSESICRSHGYKTGLFTSPHMDEVRERIRINGRPLSKEKFTAYFWKLYCKLKETETNKGSPLGTMGGMPAYFAFTVVLSLHVFISERVDVAIYEVGIGGENDCTNIFRKPAACGITSLGLDHCSILGNNIAKIAWHKAGIFKKGCPAITTIQDIPDYERRPKLPKQEHQEMSTLSSLKSLLWKLCTFFTSLPRYILPRRFFAQEPEVKSPFEVILERANEIKSPLYIASPLPEEVLTKYSFSLGIPGYMQVRNASLAVQLCRMFERRHHGGKGDVADSSVTFEPISSVEDIPRLEITELDEKTIEGLRTCFWPGRAQIVKRKGITYYLDGAHTKESIRVCASWFKDQAALELAVPGHDRGKTSRVLLYNVTGNRNPTPLLEELIDCDFDAAGFCPNLSSTLESGNRADHYNKRLTENIQRTIPLENKKAWEALTASSSATITPTTTTTTTSNLELQTESRVDPLNRPSHTFPCILQALAWATQDRDPLVKVRDPSALIPEIPSHLCEAEHIQVLVTGSIVLAGDTLGIICPEMNKDDYK